MMKKSKKKEEQPGDQPRASKCKQQSAPLASGVSVPEKAKKPKGVAAEAAVSSVLSPPTEVAKGASPSKTNVVEEERKMPALPKHAAVPRVAFGAGGVEVQGVAADTMEEVKEKEKDEEQNEEEQKEEEENHDEDDDDDSGGGGDDDEDEESGEEDSGYAPPEDGSEGTGTVTLADDVDNLPDVVKPSGKEKVSSPFDAPILPIAKTMLVKQGKKGKQGPKVGEGDDESILLLTDDEAKPGSPSKQKKKVLATKSPPPGSARKVGTSGSSKEALMMIKGCQEMFFNLPWQNYVSFLFHLYFCSHKRLYK
jgi:hypothetical protein